MANCRAGSRCTLGCKFISQGWGWQCVHGSVVTESLNTGLSLWAAGNATLRRLELDGCHKPGNSRHVGATLADSLKLSALEHLRVYEGDERKRDRDPWGRTLPATLQDMEG